MNKKIRVAVVGFGDRSEQYTKYLLKHPEEGEVVAVVDPNPTRLGYAKQKFGLQEDACYSSFEEFIARGRLADCAINGTMDNLHISTSLPLLRLGYDLLLEKPITADKAELFKLEETAKKHNCKVVVCHVLRYTPFYKRIKNILLSGELGAVRHIETAENVGVAHASVSYIRGKWNNSKECGSSYLLAKCCHDFDMICWLNDVSEPEKIVSFGGRNYFTEKNAPAGSGTRCLCDCPAEIESKCPYSARKIYLENNPMPIIVWAGLGKLPEEVTMEERIASLKGDNPHGRCIFKTDTDLVDEQMTMMYFANGSTAYHNLYSGAAQAGRRIKVYGTKGEIDGFTEDGYFTVRLYNEKNILFDERRETITDDIEGDNHYGGDARIMQDFMRIERGEAPSVSTSSLHSSVVSHLCVYAADESMEKNRIIRL